jgi:hypothetical protein
VALSSRGLHAASSATVTHRGIRIFAFMNAPGKLLQPAGPYAPAPARAVSVTRTFAVQMSDPGSSNELIVDSRCRAMPRGRIPPRE